MRHQQEDHTEMNADPKRETAGQGDGMMRAQSARTLNRKGIHVVFARLLAKWSYRLQAIFASIGFFIVLLPTLSEPWRVAIKTFPFAAWIFNEFSTLGAGALLLVAIIMVPFFILNFMIKSYPGGWDPTKEGGFPGPKQIIEKELYPCNKREEFVFWVGIFLGFIGTTVWLYLPFGVLSCFIRMGD